MGCRLIREAQTGYSAPTRAGLPVCKTSNSYETPQVHDLLQILPESVPDGTPVQPSWVTVALNSCPWVVVRRAQTKPGLTPIGVRGTTRKERWGGFCLNDGIVRVRRPEELLALSRSFTTTLRTPALNALRKMQDRWDQITLSWGPVGSAGYELATGRPVTTEKSDLDLIIRASKPIGQEIANSLWHSTLGLDVRIDVLVETPECGFSLKEYVCSRINRILLRRPAGSSFGGDPWCTTESNRKLERHLEALFAGPA